MNKVSIIIPVYNAENYLYNTINSVINQTYIDIEIILIDDNSKDNSWLICKKFAKKDSRIKILKNRKNKGVSYSRNKGLNIATGKYIVFVDSDDTVDKNYIFELVNANKEDFYDIIVANFKNVFIENNKQNKSIVKYNEISTNSLSGKFFDDYYYIKSVLTPPWGKLFKRKIIEENNIKFPIEISSGEDYIFNMQYYMFVKQYKYIDMYLYNYFHRDIKSLSKQFTVNNFKNQIKIVKKEKEFFKLCNIKNSKKMLGDCLVWRCMEYMVLKESSSYSESKQRLNLLKIVTNNPKEGTRIKDKIILNLINMNIYFPIYIYCLLKKYIGK